MVALAITGRDGKGTASRLLERIKTEVCKKLLDTLPYDVVPDIAADAETHQVSPLVMMFHPVPFFKTVTISTNSRTIFSPSIHPCK